jgi:rhodanese-related sulfurtransferase
MKTKPSAFLRDAGICALAALLSIGFGFVVNRRRGPLPPPPMATTASTIDGESLSLAGFRAAVDRGKVLIIDARDDIFYARAHVPGSLSLPERRFDACYAQLKSRIEADRARPIIVYCSNTYCDASTEVQARLHVLGYTNVAVFPDGWAAWKTAGYPEEKS